MSLVSELKPAAYYLPHETPMVLLEKVCSVTDLEVVCQVSVCKQSVLAPFLNDRGDLPSWYAFEAMAQTIGVWSGWHGKRKGASPQLGMLLGMRSFVAHVPVFTLDSLLEIHALQVLQDERLGSFSCEVKVDNKVLASARLNVYQPSTAELKQLFMRE